MKTWPLGANGVKFTHKMAVTAVLVSQGRDSFLHAAVPKGTRNNSQRN